MNRALVRVALLSTALCLLSSGVTSSEVVVSNSVVGTGSARIGDNDNIILGTLGQPAIGVLTGPSNINEVGFWNTTGSVVTGIDGDLPGLPDTYSLGQNYPNPFNPTTTITFALPTESKVMLRVYDALGRVVASLVNRTMSAGSHSVVFDAGDLASGIYFYRLTADDFVQTRKLILLK